MRKTRVAALATYHLLSLSSSVPSSDPERTPSESSSVPSSDPEPTPSESSSVPSSDPESITTFTKTTCILSTFETTETSIVTQSTVVSETETLTTVFTTVLTTDVTEAVGCTTYEVTETLTKTKPAVETTTVTVESAIVYPIVVPCPTGGLTTSIEVETKEIVETIEHTIGTTTFEVTETLTKTKPIAFESTIVSPRTTTVKEIVTRTVVVPCPTGGVTTSTEVETVYYTEVVADTIVQTLSTMYTNKPHVEVFTKFVTNTVTICPSAETSTVTVETVVNEIGGEPNTVVVTKTVPCTSVVCETLTVDTAYELGAEEERTSTVEQDDEVVAVTAQREHSTVFTRESYPSDVVDHEAEDIVQPSVYPHEDSYLEGKASALSVNYFIVGAFAAIAMF
ncbi:uncharacterized protein RJT20DRAFT_147134 [Scheffersomyces xylosifermentans]|uniref:uncharacterized protein n=1 Tax=Scheffersomyces xylosifermentans TaxID=1304137 RepID=UPI00315D07B3